MIGRTAELLHAGLELEQRVARLVLRLDLGIQGPAVDPGAFRRAQSRPGRLSAAL
jgi:hypothetical protein